MSLLFADTSLMEQMRRVVSPDDFSSPELGKIYGLCSALYNSGRTISIPALEGRLEPREMDLLASALRVNIPIDRRQQALEDYTQIIQDRPMRSKIRCFKRRRCSARIRALRNDAAVPFS